MPRMEMGARLLLGRRAAYRTKWICAQNGVKKKARYRIVPIPARSQSKSNRARRRRIR